MSLGKFMTELQFYNYIYIQDQVTNENETEI